MGFEASYRVGCAAAGQAPAGQGMWGSSEPGAPAPSKGVCLLLASYLVLFKRRLKPGQINVSCVWLRQDLLH